MIPLSPSRRAQEVALPGDRAATSGSLLKFFLLAYAITWVCFTLVAIAVPMRTPAGYLLVLIGAFSPSFAAIWLTARTGGRIGVSDLLSGILRWQVGARWYLFAAGFTVAVKLFVALAYRLALGTWPRFGDTIWLIPVAIAFSTPFQAGEEIGWRGYALPRMAAKLGFGPASLLLGLIWAFWHLPQFFIPGGDTYHQSFPVFVLGVTAFSVVMAWLYAQTRGSLLLTMLLHSAYNNSKDIVPSTVPGASNTFALSSSVVAWLTLAVLWICAGVFLVKMRKKEPGPAAAAEPDC
jgi:membrane protease YdiL (CAAX protease family)